ncbi:uncharacterized protein IL334_007525 [Kwoniella shivajii]|uniref:Protein-lysine N-methyltransferase EFM6 n=1 Tax=Kwoniella shivajii TaxID=564305 RepID=A0ABZ1DCV2_9TREE|nr:hypothetical protein IL334_007525 [Kwoniella shivajii]
MVLVPDPASPRSRSRSSSVSTTNSDVALPSFASLAPSRPPTTVAEEETRVSIPGLEKKVILKIDAGPGCGGVAWAAGEVLSRYISYRYSIDPTILRNKKVLELGSGTGLVGIVAGLLDPSSEVWVTDQEILLDLMEINAELNIPSPIPIPTPTWTTSNITSVIGRRNVHAVELNWGEDLSDSDIPIEEIDLVLAADCVYFEPAFPLLIKTLCDLAPVGKEMDILFCWKKRRNADKRFFSMLKKHFDQITIQDDKIGEKDMYGKQGVSLIKLVRRK